MKVCVRGYPAVAILVFAFPQHGSPQIAFAACETNVLKVIDPPFRPSSFGFDVAMDGDLIVAGAFEDDELGNFAGAAHVIRKDGANWVFQQKLTASDGFFHDNFGFAVDIEGDVIVVGAPHIDPAGQGAGRAYVFRRNINETPIRPEDDFWEEEAILAASEPRHGENLGRSVSISGNTIVLGTSVISFETGRALVFQYCDGKWIEQSILVNSDAEPEDGFGNFVKIHSDIIAVGAQLDDDPIVGSRAGSAYIFRKNEDRWIEETKLTASDMQSYTFFGKTLTVNNSQLIVGSRFADGVGAAYVFQYQDNTWIETDKITPPDSSSRFEFGSYAEILEDTLVIGSPRGAYIYQLVNNNWNFHEQITSSKIEPESFYVTSLTLTNEHVLIGNHGRVFVSRIRENCLTIADFAEFQLCFGQSTLDHEECTRFDLVPDQTINIDDFQAVLPLIQSP